MLPVVIAVFAVAIWLGVLFGLTVKRAAEAGGLPNFWLLGGGVLAIGLGVFLCFGFFTLQPNEGACWCCLGRTVATVRTAAGTGRIRSTASFACRSARGT